MRTIGVEEELLIVDGSTGCPLPAAGALLAAGRLRDQNRGDSETVNLTSEFKLEQIEIVSRPCTELEALLDEIRHGRGAADTAAKVAGGRVAALATSPVPVTPHTTPEHRYATILDRFALTARQQLTCGFHVHVAIGSDEEGVAVMDRIRNWLPVLAALSANSPFWNGADTGYASYRTQAWSRWPSAGPLGILGSAPAYHALVRSLVSSGVILDEGMIYFDVRLARHHPTLEVRVADVCMEARDAAVLAGITRALVETACLEWRAGVEPQPYPTPLLRLAVWRASRSGIDGTLLHPLTGRPQPAREVIGVLLGHVAEALALSGDTGFVNSGVTDILHRGSGERRQRKTLAANGTLAGVVADALSHTHLGIDGVRQSGRCQGTRSMNTPGQASIDERQDVPD